MVKVGNFPFIVESAEVGSENTDTWDLKSGFVLNLTFLCIFFTTY